MRVVDRGGERSAYADGLENGDKAREVGNAGAENVDRRVEVAE